MVSCHILLVMLYLCFIMAAVTSVQVSLSPNSTTSSFASSTATLSVDPIAKFSSSTPTTNFTHTTTAKPQPSNSDATTPKPQSSKSDASTAKPQPSNSDATTAKLQPSNSDATTPKPQSSNSDATTAKPQPSNSDATTAKPQPSNSDATTAKPQPSNSDATTAKPQPSNSDATTPKPQNKISESYASTSTSTTLQTPTTALPPVYVIPLGMLQIPVNFQIKYEVAFDSRLLNTTSDFYNETFTDFTEELNFAFQNVTGFHEIIVTGFWNDTAMEVVNFTLFTSYQNETGIKQLQKDINSLVSSYLNSLQRIDQSFLVASFNESLERVAEAMKNVCISAQEPCHKGYYCRLNSTGSQIFCEHKCHGDACRDEELCELDSQDNPVCYTVTTTLTTSPVNTSSTGMTTTKGSSTQTPTASVTTRTSSSTQTQKVTTTYATSTIPPTYKPKIEVPLNLSVRFLDVTYTEDLGKPDSDAYIKAVDNYKEILTQAYKNLDGFKRIIINSFWNGSIGIDFTAVIDMDYSSDDYLENITKQLENIVIPLASGSGGGSQSFHDYIKNSLKQAVASVRDNCNSSSTNMCLNDYACHWNEDTDQPICEHKCTDMKCGNNGYCVLDTAYTPKCRCVYHDNFVYGGDSCEIEAEKLALTKDYIIAIAAGSGGGIILILVIVIIVILRKRRPGKKSSKEKIPDTASEQSFKSIKDSEDGLHDVLIGHGNTAQLDYNNPSYRLENLGFNPRTGTSVPGSQAPLTDPLNLSRFDDRQLHMKPEHGAERPRQSRSGSGSDAMQHPDRKSRDGNSTLYSYIRDNPPSSDYVMIDDTESVSTMYQPTRNMRVLPEFHHAAQRNSPGEAKVYDYTRSRTTSAASASSHPHSNRAFYDFDYENGTDRGSRIEDPYAIQRPRVSSQKRF